MKWKDRSAGGNRVRNVRRTERLALYPWEGEEYRHGSWEARTWTDAGRWDDGSSSSSDLVPADEPEPHVTIFGNDCTICEQSEPVDEDGICEHCRERLNKLGYFKNSQCLAHAEQLGTLKGLIERLAEKCK